MDLSTNDVVIGCVEDRVVPGLAGPIGIRVYTPIAGDASELPGLIYFHGGGLVAGSLDTHEGICRTLANEICCRLVSVDYRLAPEHKFPAGLIDGYSATMWLINHASELRIDRERIAIGGDSAGGTLAMVICQLIKHVPGVHLAAQLLLCPITDFAAETESRRSFATGHLIDKALMARDLKDYLPDSTEATDSRVSPLHAPDFGNLPSSYIHTAEFDPLRDEGRAYADALIQVGVKVNYTCHPGMIHLFYGMSCAIPYARIAMKRIGAEIKMALRRPH